MSNEATTLADRFLKDMCETHHTVSMYLVSGFQLKGEVMAFDEETIVFRRKDVHQLVMRSAVAVMYPVLQSKNAPREWWRKYERAAPNGDQALGEIS